MACADWELIAKAPQTKITARKKLKVLTDLFRIIRKTDPGRIREKLSVCCIPEASYGILTKY